jgi:NAD(P)-dependent dehydrogenase (short-subunit alcohol dehydrogenase family)
MVADVNSGGRPVALVTGAGGGLGGAIARALAEKGFDLVLSDLVASESLSECTAATTALGADTAILLQDIAQVEQLAAFVEVAHARFDRLDCLINNAGVSVLSRGDILDVTSESFDRCIAVNLRAQFFLTQAVARRMLKDAASQNSDRRKSIITVTSVAVDDIIGKMLAEYSISKAALSHMVKHFAVRLAPAGIDCYELRPGMMNTTMTASSREKYDGLIAAGIVPAHRWGELHEIGRTVANLADGVLQYAVGQVISVDGGMRLKVF